jgi:hypothetical protein
MNAPDELLKAKEIETLRHILNEFADGAELNDIDLVTQSLKKMAKLVDPEFLAKSVNTIDRLISVMLPLIKIYEDTVRSVSLNKRDGEFERELETLIRVLELKNELAMYNNDPKGELN